MLVRARYVASSLSCAHSSQVMARFVHRHICGDSIQPRRTDTKTMPKVPIPKVQSATACKVKMPKIRLLRSQREHIGASAQYLDLFPFHQSADTPARAIARYCGRSLSVCFIGTWRCVRRSTMTGSHAIPRPHSISERYPRQRELTWQRHGGRQEQTWL